MVKGHSFHIPVMGIAFTVDTPFKVSKYGIDSSISLVDDILLEKLRKSYCNKFQFPYEEISDKVDDFRSKRITEYLNLMNDLAHKNFEELKQAAVTKRDALKEYFNLLPDDSSLKLEFTSLKEKCFNLTDIRNWIQENLKLGSIDVNIMTKIDKTNYKDEEPLSIEYNDAHAALRGYATSNLQSSIIFSAGMNPHLYSYAAQFKDFYPDKTGFIKKKIIIKVSDYRSAFIQGRFLAKKGLWVSEYRIESGLNCGGHAFATDGHLLGPVLAEFRDKRNDLIQATHNIYVDALERNNKTIPNNILPLKVTAQGGVGTAEEHQFLIDHYNLNSVGWGTPFLLVPEATTVDDPTIDKLILAKEKDLYLSNVSPLGIPFNNLRGNTKDDEKLALMDKGRPGSSCPKKYVALNNDLTDKTICTASRQYQFLKIKELDLKNLSRNEYQKEYAGITEKSCICVGLGTSALLVHELDTKKEGKGVSICPGPNMAYFSKVMSLAEITGHIYNRQNMIERNDRPNMFVKEISLYIDFLRNKIEETDYSSPKQIKYLNSFLDNMKSGVQYYTDLFTELKGDLKFSLLNELNVVQETLQSMTLELTEFHTSEV